MANGRRRDGLTGFTDTSNGEMRLTAPATLPGGFIRGSPTPTAMRPLSSRDKGVGLLTVSIVPVDSLIQYAGFRSVKFTVATSPDTPKAKMCGAIWPTRLPRRLDPSGQNWRVKVSDAHCVPGREQRDTDARLAHTDAAGSPDAGGCAANRLPRIDQRGVVQCQQRRRN